VRELRESGYSHCETPGGPKNKEETRKEHRQTCRSRPLLDGSSNDIGDRQANQDENDVNRK